MLRKIATVLAGAVTAFVLVAVIEKLGHLVYPPPANLDFTDSEELAAHIQGLPAGAFLFVLLAWAIGTLGGGLVACLIAREKPLRYALIIGVLMLIASGTNLATISHPLWFSVSALGAILFMMFLTIRIAGAMGRVQPGGER